MKRFLPIGVIFVAAWVGSFAANAQYPDKPITMIVPFPPGGVADTVARPVAEALSRELKQSVVIENKSGAGGAVGIGQAARAAGDGYTLLMSLSSISILPEADKILDRKPMFQIDQFKPIARITADPTVLVVRADAPWRTLEDFIADVRRKPAGYNYGSSGNYGTMHVPMEMLKSAAGFRMTHIPYSGAGPAVIALLGGHVDAISSGPASVAQHIRAGRLRALAHWGDKPLATLPDVPSLKERGYNVQFAQWSALFAPAATPEPIVEKLRATVRKVVSDPALQQTILNAGSPIEYLDAPQFAAYWKTDAQTMTEAVKRIGKVE